MTFFSRHRAALFLVSGLVAVGVLSGVAQAAPEPDELVSRSLTRMAVLDLRRQPAALPSDYAMIASMLEIALEVTPDDASLWRRLIEAHRAAGNERGVMLATRNLVAVDPEDTVAQLRLLSWNASQKQTLQERLTVYELYLGEEGVRAIPDPSVRSRLALDAALLYRETGDEEEFVRHLALATSLDSTNKEAAALALAFFQERRSDPVGALELAVNLLRSDPLDPNLHFALTSVFVKHGVFDQAQRFHNNGRRLIASAGAGQDRGIDTEAVVLRWHTSGAERVIAEFDDILLLQIEDAKRRVARLQKDGLSLESVTLPEDVRLPLHNERIRVLAAAAIGDQVVIERSLRDLEASIGPELESLIERMQTPDAAADAQLMQSLVSRAATLASDLLVAKLVAGDAATVAASEVEVLRSLFGEGGKAQLDVIDALVVLRQGRIDEAVELFIPLGELSTLGSLGLGLAQEEAGRIDEAAEAYAVVARFSPLSPTGAFSRSRYEVLTGHDLEFTQHTESMERVADEIPGYIDTLTTEPRRFMSFTVTLENSMLDPYDFPAILLNVRNTSAIALGVGSDRPINSRLMISPAMDVASFPITAVLEPEISDMHHRLRLVPGESLSLRVWPDPGFAGWIADTKSAHRVRSRWNVLQGFQVGSGRRYQVGPMCLSGETQLLSRQPDIRVRANIEDLIREVELYAEDRLVPMFMTLKALLADYDRPGGRPTAEQVTRISNVLAARYPALSPHARLAMIAIIPHAVSIPGMEQLDERILAETDPVVLRAALLSRVRSADHPAIGRALVSQDAALAEFARALDARLRNADPTGYAFIGPVGSHRPAAPQHPEATDP